MGTILIYAGMHKTGSTSIQQWLWDNAGELREQHGIHPLGGPTTADEGADLVRPLEDGARLVPRRFLVQHAFAASRDERSRGDVAERFCRALAARAEERGTVLVAFEQFSTFISGADEPMLDHLNRLGQQHDVSVAYYIRPQHHALESRWRQWGFRSATTPSEWVRQEMAHLDYLGTEQLMRELAPEVTFHVLPFRSDLLEQGDVVVDFASEFLQIDPLPAVGSYDMDPALPLDLANVLHQAPETLLHPKQRNDGAFPFLVRQKQLATLGQKWNLAESPLAHRSRALLHRVAHESFEPANQELIARRGWPVDEFIPCPPDEDAPETSDLSDLDQLWSPDDSVLRDHLYAALDDLLTR